VRCSYEISAAGVWGTGIFDDKAMPNRAGQLASTDGVDDRWPGRCRIAPLLADTLALVTLYADYRLHVGECSDLRDLREVDVPV